MLIGGFGNSNEEQDLQQFRFRVVFALIAVAGLGRR